MSENDIKQFLDEFKANMNLFGILYANRDKNTQTLVDLEITPKFRDDVLLNLKIVDYCEGPLKNDQFGSSPMWVFGAEIKKNEIYIKITCLPTKAFCISFHISEYPLNYPFKN